MNDSNFIYGIHPILEAITADKTIEKIFVLKETQNEQVAKIIKLCRAKDIPIKFVPNEKLNRLTNKNHQGICAFLSPIVFYSVEELVPRILEKKESPIFLILANITDVRNFGAITRSAECANVDAIIIPTERTAALNEDAIKTSAGAIFNIPICKEKNLIDVVDFLKQLDIKVFSASEKAKSLVYEANLTSPMALILGSEEYGIDKKLLDRSDEVLKLPILGKTQSLNVSVACGIFLYEITRQRS